ncbi:MAG: hypothetical protein E7331_02090 [Clostridiales bacterium]|nr:hypothetical protein [Clostridiales bacterium]
MPAEKEVKPEQNKSDLAKAENQTRQERPSLDGLPDEKRLREDADRVHFLVAQIDRWSASMERLRLADYMRYVDDRKRMFWSNFWGGIARGVGMAIGFSVLGALLVWLLQNLARKNLPWIGEVLDYIMEAIRPD